jgi:hypothetical protein
MRDGFALPPNFATRLGWALRTALALALTFPLVIPSTAIDGWPLPFLTLIVAIVYPTTTFGATLSASISGFIGVAVGTVLAGAMSQLLALCGAQLAPLLLPLAVLAFPPIFAIISPHASVGGRKFGLAVGFITLCVPIRSPAFDVWTQFKLATLTCGGGMLAALVAVLMPLPLPALATLQLRAHLRRSAALLTRSLRLVQTVIASNRTQHIASLRQHADRLAELQVETVALEAAASTELALASLCCCGFGCGWARAASARMSRRVALLRTLSANLAAWRRTMSDRKGFRVTPTQIGIAQRVKEPMNLTIRLLIRLINTHVGGGGAGTERTPERGCAAMRARADPESTAAAAMRAGSTAAGAGGLDAAGTDESIEHDAEAPPPPQPGTLPRPELSSAALEAQLEEMLEQYAVARRDVLYRGSAVAGEDDRAFEHMRRTASVFFFSELSRDAVLWMRAFERSSADDR